MSVVVSLLFLFYTMHSLILFRLLLWLIALSFNSNAFLRLNITCPSSFPSFIQIIPIFPFLYSIYFFIQFPLPTILNILLFHFLPYCLLVLLLVYSLTRSISSFSDVPLQPMFFIYPCSSSRCRGNDNSCRSVDFFLLFHYL